MSHASDAGDLTFSVEVEYTDRTRTASGRFVIQRTTVHLLAPTEIDAHLVAAQWVAATRPPDFMVTATTTTAVVA